jgi:hypothetical protein
MGKKNDVNLGRIIGKVIQGVVVVGGLILTPIFKKKWDGRKKS